MRSKRRRRHSRPGGEKFFNENLWFEEKGIYEFCTTKQFLRSWRRVPAYIRQRAHEKIALLFDNAAHPSLKVHELRRRPGVRECYITFSYRLLFSLCGNRLTLIDIGPHDCVDHAHRTRGAP